MKFGILSETQFPVNHDRSGRKNDDCSARLTCSTTHRNVVKIRRLIHLNEFVNVFSKM